MTSSVPRNAEGKHMGAGNLIEIARVRDAVGCRELLERARQYDRTNEKSGNNAQRTSMLLQTVASLIHDFGRMKVSAEEGYEILEQIRTAAIEGFEKLRFSGVARLGLPSSSAAWEPLRRVMLAFKSMRNHYKRIYMGLLEDEGLQTRTIIPGTANSLRTVMPLARALDCQSRFMAFALLNQIELDSAEWDEFCVMARHLRVSTFLDETLPDPCALIRPNTSRALFVYPVLLWLAKPFSRTHVELQLVDKLARKWAAKVGFRIDSGQQRKDNPQGPSIVLTTEHVVRLDTHKLLRSLVERHSEISDPMGTKQGGLPAGVSLSQVIDLLNSLETVWGNSGWLDATDAGTGPSSDVVMRLGLPTLGTTDADAGSVQSWFTRSQGEPVQYFSSIRTVLRKHALPLASHGTLVALSTKKARPSELVVGVVQHCSQATDIELAPPHATKLGLRLVTGLARAIDVMLPDSNRFEPAYGIFADESDETPSSIVVIAGRCTLPCDMQVRDTEGVYKARLELKIERLAGYERVSVMRIS
jgi:hypothetical protein